MTSRKFALDLVSTILVHSLHRPRTYFYGLDPTEREAFARRVQTTVEYIQCHLITRRKIPRPDSMRKLAAASQDQVSLDDLLAYFYKADKESNEIPF